MTPKKIVDTSIIDVSQYIKTLCDDFKLVHFNGLVVILFTSGSRTIIINGRRYEIDSPHLMLLAPNTLGKLESKSEDNAMRIAAISLESVMEMPTPIDIEIINTARHSPLVSVPQDRLDDFTSYFDRVDRCISQCGHTYQKQLLNALIYTLVLEIADLHYSVGNSQVTNTKIRQVKLSDDFFLLLSEYYKNERSVAFYANRMHLTPKYLSGQIKRITGKSIHEWINESLLIEIKILLRTTTSTVLQISEQLNFPNPSTFVQYFKLHEGTTPHKYRNR